MNKAERRKTLNDARNLHRDLFRFRNVEGGAYMQEIAQELLPLADYIRQLYSNKS